MSFVFDLPLIVTGSVIVLLLVVGSVTGLHIFRQRIHPFIRYVESDAHFVAAMVASIMVFYALAMALIAVHVWVTYEDAARTTSVEASSIAALYRDVSEYPEPLRTELRDDIREYIQYTIHEAWPQMRKGHMPSGGVSLIDSLQRALMAFEPRTESQKLLAAETLRGFNHMVETRRMRLDAVEIRLPGVWWVVILLGAVVGMLSTYYFPVKDPRLHRTLVGLLSAFIGLVMMLVLALDRPFRGDLGLSPAPYELIHDQLMKQ
jgi:hypothetical protein